MADSMTARLAELLVNEMGRRAEPIMTMATGMAAPPLALASAGINKLAGNKWGTAQQVFDDTMQRAVYQPKTEGGQEELRRFGKMMDVAKIPPYIPQLGITARAQAPAGLGAAARQGVGELKQLGQDIATDMHAGSAAYAVKPPGGHWTNSSMTRMAELLKGGGGEGVDTPAHVQEWLDKMVPRYLQRQLGTDRDPARNLRVGENTYEQLGDRSIRSKTYEQLQGYDQGIGPGELPDMPQNIRAGENAWHFNPRPPMADFLRHAGDYAQTLTPEDLARTDIPTLLQQTSRQAGRAVKKRIEGQEFFPAVRDQMANHPGGPLIQGENASWFRYDKSMDPQLIRQGLSADTCVGRHCIGGVKTASGEPGFPAGSWLPMVDIRSGEAPPGVSNTALSPYARGVQGGNQAYSLRTPEGNVVATAYANKPAEAGIPRSQIRDLIGKPTYLNWQKRMAEQGVPVEAQKWVLPGGRVRVNIGEDPQIVNVGEARGSPARGTLSPEQIKSIVQMHPGTEELLKPYMNGPTHQNLEQVKGYMNRPVSPKYQDEMAALFNKPGELNVGTATGDLAQSGFLKQSRGVLRPREIIEQAMDAPQQQGRGAIQPETVHSLLRDPTTQRILNTPPERLTDQEAQILRHLYATALKVIK